MRQDRLSPTVCRCGVPWELPCKCPESVLERLTTYHGSQCFYFEDFKKWVVAEFGTPDNDIIQSTLNLDGIVELGDSAYQSPFEL